MSMRSLWRQLWAGAMAGLCLLFGAFAGSASAALRLAPETTEAHVEIDTTVNWFTGTPGAFGTPAGNQYFAYWDSDGVLALARKEERGRVTQQRLTEEVIPNISDYRSTIGFALSTDGRFHVSYQERDGAHRYLISTEACTLSRCTFRWARYQVDRASESWMEYPAFIKAPDGTLFFTWRSGTDTDGAQYLNYYNENGTWTHRGAILNGTDGSRYEFDPDGGGPAETITSSVRAPILDEIVFDKNEGMHVAWNWREEAATEANQHGTFYAYSADGGASWVDHLGRAIATSRSDPITFADATTLVAPDPPGYFIESSSLAIDSHENPHLVKSLSAVQTDDRVMTNLRRTHLWRTLNGEWHWDYIEGSGAGSTPGTGGELFFDSADNAYVIYARTETLGWEPWNANPYLQDDLPLRNVSWHARELLRVRVHSLETALRTTDYVGVPINNRENNELTIRMRNDTTSRDLRVFFTTDADGTWSLGKGQTFSVLNSEDTRYTEYSVAITDSDWNGTLRQLEIHPVEQVTSGSVTIGSIRLRQRGTGRNLVYWEFDRGQVVMAAEAAPAGNWGSWTIEPLLPNTVDGIGDRKWGIDAVRFDQTGSRVEFPVLESAGLAVKRFRLPFDIGKDWDFEADEMGWAATRHVSGFESIEDSGTNVIAGTLAGEEGQIRSGDYLHLEDTARYVHIRMRRTTNVGLRGVRVSFSTYEGGSGEASVGLSESSAGYTTYTANMEAIPGTDWEDDVVRRVWLTFVGIPTTRGDFYIDRIWSDARP